MGAPWFRLYAQDFMADTKVRLLDDASVGVLVKLWCLCCSDGGFPSDPKALGKLLSKRPDHAHQAFLKVASFFVDHPLIHGIKTSSRLLAEQAEYEGKVLANQANGKLGGRPKKNPLGLQDGTQPVNPTITEPEPEPEPEKDKKIVPAAPKPPRPAKVQVVGSYPPELDLAMAEWRRFLREMHPLANGFPPEKRKFIATSAGSKEAVWNAWQRMTAMQVSGCGFITSQDLLESVKGWANAKLKRAEDRIEFAAPMLSTMMNKPEFLDLVIHTVRARCRCEVSNAS